MKRFCYVLAAVALLAVPAFCAAQTPEQVIYDALAAQAATTQQDNVDFYAAVLSGCGNRLAIGPYRQVTLAVRQYVADAQAAKASALPDFQTRMGGILAPSPQRACRIATAAVIGLEMAQAFGAQIPPQVIQAAMALQKQICAQQIHIVVETNTPTKPCGCNPPLAKPQTITIKDATSNWLSPQFILDGCAGSNGGCGGDDNTTVLANAKSMGIPTEADYSPYVAYNQGCQTMASGTLLYTVSDWGYADSSTTSVADTALIKAAIMKYGGVGCAVAADGSFMGYSGGVFSGNARGINHDVYLAGWDDAKGAWLMVNSWGPGWGINPATGVAAGKPAATKPTGLKLPPPNVRAAKHAAYRARNMRAVADLAKLADNLPASYTALATQPPIADQANCGSCWDFSGVRCVSAANILAGTLPRSQAPMAGGCMWIKYGSNEIGTEAVWCMAGKPVPYVAPPGPGPSPQPGPTRRTSVLFEKATRVFQRNPALVERAIKAAEDVLETAP